MRLCVGTLLLILSSIALGHGKANQSSIGISIIKLIATPEQYHGKQIRVIGAGNLEFEGNLICLSKDDLKYGITRNCLWLSISPKSIDSNSKELESYNGKYVLVEGIFNSTKTGHFGMASGSIEKINRYQNWEK